MLPTEDEAISDVSGQIIATSHDRPQKVVKQLRKGTPLISGKSRLVKSYNLFG